MTMGYGLAPVPAMTPVRDLAKPCPCGFGCWEGKGCLAKDEPDDCAATGDGCQPETIGAFRQCRYCGKDMPLTPNGIRVQHTRRRFPLAGLARWTPGLTEPTRIRVCRGSRR